MKNVSKQEGRLISYFNQKNKPCFTTLEAIKVYPYFSENSIEKLLSKMAHKGLLMRVQKGLYYLIPYEQDAEHFIPDWHLLAPCLTREQPYYIGYYAALQIHGFNTQPSLKEQIVVKEQVRPRVRLVKGIPFQFIYHNPQHFFGYQSTWIDSFHQVNCSDIEKTIIDSLFKPNYAGGIVEIAKALYLARKQLDMQKLFVYSQQFDSQAVVKRLGFLLDLLGIKTAILEKLQKIKTRSTVLLDPQIPAVGKTITRWSIQQNVDTFSIQSPLYT